MTGTHDCEIPRRGDFRWKWRCSYCGQTWLRRHAPAWLLHLLYPSAAQRDRP